MESMMGSTECLQGCMDLMATWITLKKCFAKHRALNKGEPHYSDSPGSHLSRGFLPQHSAPRILDDPTQILLTGWCCVG